jgi:outer membrane protein OmpA-like peptidoglycan-associated protein
MIRDQLSPELLGQISKAIGENPEATQSALSHSVPALLGSAAAEASSPQGATNLFNLLKDKAPQGGWATSASSLLSSLTGGGGGVGSALVTALLGSKAGMIRDFIASRSGIRSESASSLLGFGGQILSTVLGKQVAAQGLGASGFGQLLRSQIPHLQGMLPPDLSNMLGIGNLLGTAKSAVQQGASAVQSQASELASAARPAVSSASRNLRLALIPLAVLAAVIFLAHRYSKSQADMGGASDENWAARGTGTGMSSNLQLPGVTDFTERMKTAIASSDGSQVELTGVSFDNDGKLSAMSQSALASLGGLLNSTPATGVTVTSYGNTSEEADARANAIKSVLVTTGVAENRITAHGEIGQGIPKVSFRK